MDRFGRQTNKEANVALDDLVTSTRRGARLYGPRVVDAGRPEGSHGLKSLYRELSHLLLRSDSSESRTANARVNHGSRQ